jgi:phosphohistidine phosphatase SixA
MNKKKVSEEMRPLFDPTTLDPAIQLHRQGIAQAEQIKALAKEKIKDPERLKQTIERADKTIKFYEKGIKQLEKTKEKIMNNHDKLDEIINSPLSKAKGGRK